MPLKHKQLGLFLLARQVSFSFQLCVSQSRKYIWVKKCVVEYKFIGDYSCLPWLLLKVDFKLFTVHSYCSLFSLLQALPINPEDSGLPLIKRIQGKFRSGAAAGRPLRLLALGVFAVVAAAGSLSSSVSIGWIFVWLIGYRDTWFITYSHVTRTSEGYIVTKNRFQHNNIGLYIYSIRGKFCRRRRSVAKNRGTR